MSKRALWILGCIVLSPPTVKLLAIIAWLILKTFDHSKVWPYPEGKDVFYAAALGLIYILPLFALGMIVSAIYTAFFKKTKPAVIIATPAPDNIVAEEPKRNVPEIDTTAMKLGVAKIFNAIEADKAAKAAIVASISKEECIKCALATIPEQVKYAIDTNGKFVIVNMHSVYEVAEDHQRIMFHAIVDDLAAILKQAGIRGVEIYKDRSFISIPIEELKKFSNHEKLALLEE